MSYQCKILQDSISETGKRLTTMEITFPRCVLAEAETHRVFRGFGGNVEELIIKNLGINVDENLSRNSASSRAIPISKMVKMVRENPFIPEQWGKPVKGMGAKEYYEAGSPEDMKLTSEWDRMRQLAIDFAIINADIGNKEDLNRMLEPFMWHTAIITATEFDNFFKLRTNEAADWKIRKIADLMYEAYHCFDGANSLTDLVEKGVVSGRTDMKEIRVDNKNNWSAVIPIKLKVGEWHCPLVTSTNDHTLIEEYMYKEDIALLYKIKGYDHDQAMTDIEKKISVARCARVSYLTHDGKRDVEKDLELFERLRTSGHWSPFEHVATPYFNVTNHESLVEGITWEEPRENLRSGNFIGWKQYRKEFIDENCISFRKEN